MADLSISFLGDSSSLVSAAGQAEAALGRVESSATKAAHGIQTAMTGVAVAGAAALAAGFTGAVTAAAGFEKQMSAVGAVAGATASEMQALTAMALQLGKDTSFSASEAATGLEELIKAGVSVADALGGAGRAALDLAAAGAISVGDAAEIASNAMNVFGLKGADMAHVADVIAGAANASAISVNDYKFSLSAAGAVAATVGIGFEDLSTAIAVMGQAGIKGSDAGTSLKTMLLNLQPASNKQIDLFRELGITTTDTEAGYQNLVARGIQPAGKSYQELSQAIQTHLGLSADISKWSKDDVKAFDALSMGVGLTSNAFFDAGGKAKDMAGIAEVLREKLGGMTKAAQLSTLEIMFGSDAIRAGAVLLDAGAEGFNNMAEAMGKVTAQQVAETRLNNLFGSVEKLKGSLETGAIILGSMFTPALKEMADMLTGQVNDGIEILEQIPDAIATIQQVLADDWMPDDSIHPFVNAVGKAALTIKGFVGTVQALPAPLKAAGIAFAAVMVGAKPLMAALPILAGGLKLLAAPIAALLSPLGLLAVGIAGLAAAWTANLGGIQEKTQQFVDLTQLYLLGFVLNVQQALGGDVAGAIENLGVMLGNFSTDLGTILADWGQEFVAWVPGAISALVTALSVQVARIPWATIWSQATTAATELATYVSSLAVDFTSWLSEQAALIPWSTVWAAASTVAIALGTFLLTQVIDFATWLSAQVALIPWATVWESASTVATALATYVGSLVVDFTTWLSAQVTLIRWDAIWTKATTVATALGTYVKTLAVDFTSWLGEQAAQIPWATVWAKATEVATALGTYVKGLAVDFATWLGAQVAAIPWADVWSKATAVATDLATYLGGLTVDFATWLGAQVGAIPWADVWARVTGLLETMTTTFTTAASGIKWGEVIAANATMAKDMTTALGVKFQEAITGIDWIVTGENIGRGMVQAIAVTFGMAEVSEAWATGFGVAIVRAVPAMGKALVDVLAGVFMGAIEAAWNLAIASWVPGMPTITAPTGPGTGGWTVTPPAAPTGPIYGPELPPEAPAAPAAPAAVSPPAAAPAPPPAAPQANRAPIDNSSRASFVRTAWPYMLEAAGGNRDLAEMMLGAAISENGDVGKGGSFIGNNFFGIKGTGPAGSVTANTWEMENGVRVPQPAQFAAYNTPTEGFGGFMDFLKKNPRYAPALAAFEQTGDAQRLFNDINAAGYATDPNWASTVGNIRRNQVAPVAAGLPNNNVAAAVGAATAPPPMPAFDGTKAAIGNQMEMGLPYADAIAACGPAAVALFMQATGRTPNAQEIMEISAKNGWTRGAGMGGVGAFQQTLSDLGVDSALLPFTQATAGAVAAGSVQAGNLTAISTGAHYNVAQGFDPSTGKFDLGETGGVVPGGSRYMTIEEITALQGPVNGIIQLLGQAKVAIDETGVSMQTMGASAAADLTPQLAGIGQQIDPLVAQFDQGALSASGLTDAIVLSAANQGIATESTAAYAQGMIGQDAAMRGVLAAFAETTPAAAELLTQLDSGAISTDQAAIAFAGLSTSTAIATGALGTMATDGGTAIETLAATGVSQMGLLSAGAITAADLMNTGVVSAATLMGAGVITQADLMEDGTLTAAGLMKAGAVSAAELMNQGVVTEAELMQADAVLAAEAMHADALAEIDLLKSEGTESLAGLHVDGVAEMDTMNTEAVTAAQAMHTDASEAIASLATEADESFGAVSESAGTAVEGMEAVGEVDIAAPDVSDVLDAMEDIEDAADKALKAIKDINSASKGGSKGGGGSGLGKSEKGDGGFEGRAAGGPVAGGVGYIVGENGPEFFMPTEDGVIIPNHRIRGFRALGGPVSATNPYSPIGTTMDGISGEFGRYIVEDITRLTNDRADQVIKSLNELTATMVEAAQKAYDQAFDIRYQHGEMLADFRDKLFAVLTEQHADAIDVQIEGNSNARVDRDRHVGTLVAAIGKIPPLLTQINTSIGKISVGTAPRPTTPTPTPTPTPAPMPAPEPVNGNPEPVPGGGSGGGGTGPDPIRGIVPGPIPGPGGGRPGVTLPIDRDPVRGVTPGPGGSRPIPVVDPVRGVNPTPNPAPRPIAPPVGGAGGSGGLNDRMTSTRGATSTRATRAAADSVFTAVSESAAAMYREVASSTANMRAVSTNDVDKMSRGVTDSADKMGDNVGTIFTGLEEDTFDDFIAAAGKVDDALSVMAVNVAGYVEDMGTDVAESFETMRLDALDEIGLLEDEIDDAIFLVDVAAVKQADLLANHVVAKIGSMRAGTAQQIALLSTEMAAALAAIAAEPDTKAGSVNKGAKEIGEAVVKALGKAISNVDDQKNKIVDPLVKAVVGAVAKAREKGEAEAKEKGAGSKDSLSMAVLPDPTRSFVGSDGPGASEIIAVLERVERAIAAARSIEVNYAQAGPPASLTHDVAVLEALARSGT